MTYAHPSRIDEFVERVARRVAQRTSRRSFLAKLGYFVVGGAVLPMLPVDRSFKWKQASAEGFAETAQVDDPSQCDYWRYCAFDGYICDCCGGSVTSCPPGTKASPTAWIGSCINPDDGQTYLISYNDCCGKDSCGRCGCLNTEGEMPVYRAQLNNDIVWCFGLGDVMTYHCTVGAIVGKA